MRSDPALAIQALKRLLESSSSPQVKERALFVLAQSNSPDAQNLLIEIAIKQSDPNLKRRAVDFIAAQPARQRLAVLGEIYRTSADQMVKSSILDAYASCGCRKELFSIALKETNPELRRYAIESLGSLGDRESLWQLYTDAGSTREKAAIERSLIVETRRAAIDILAAVAGKGVLVEIFVRERDLQVKLHIIDSLTVMGAAKELIAIDRKEKDPTLHREITQGLSNMSAPEVQDYMIEILKK